LSTCPAFCFCPIDEFGNIFRFIKVDIILGLCSFIQQIDDLLGFDLIASTPDIDEDLKRLIIERKFAKDNRDFERADAIRAELLEQGIEILDTKNQPLWRRVK